MNDFGTGNQGAQNRSDRTQNVFLAIAALITIGSVVLAIWIFGNNQPVVQTASAPSTTQPQPSSEPTPEPEPAKEPEAEPTPEPETEPSPEPEAEPATEPEPETEPTTEPSAPATASPKFDLVRVDKQGNAVVAGTAEPNSNVKIMGNGESLASVTSDAQGNFVALFDMPKTGEPTTLELVTQDGTTQPSVSQETFLVMPIEPEAEEAPKIVAATEDSVEVVQRPEPVAEPAPLITELTIDTIEYSQSGDVILGGSANSDQPVRVYVDNEPTETSVAEDGQWRLALPNIDEGIYTVRVDALDESGGVTARAETPFKREIPQEGLGSKVTIQPGFTLWALAEEKYGSGTRYVQIYEANRASIKDPDLIYPGQVFDLPDAQ